MDDARSAQARARDLQAAGRPEEALLWARRAVDLAPGSGVAAHNLAALLGDLSLFGEAADWSRRAIDLGTKGAETWIVHARAMQGAGDLDAADAAYERAIMLRQDYIDAYRELAQLRWMRDADSAAACRHFDGYRPRDALFVELAGLKARLQIAMLDYAGARRTLDDALRLAPAHPGLHIARALLAAEEGDPQAHLDHAVAALQAQRGSHEAAKGVAEALLHCGRADEAATLAARIREAVPDDQGILALLTTAWRLTGDPRHDALCADPALVAGRMIEVPPGWADLPAFLGDLKATLEARHRWKTHPLEQSLRHGSQTQEDLTRADDPVLGALFTALKRVIADHIVEMGPGDDPVRGRAGQGLRLGGAWSVRLRPGGFHKDHVHPQGWLSSAFYVDLPDAVAEEGTQGWLAFGRPGIPTRPELGPIRSLQPRPGMIAIFPSYLWHGTEPFSGDQTRLTVAFDILPAA